VTPLGSRGAPSRGGTPPHRVLVSRSAAATARLGRRLGRLLRAGDVVALVGELGAGKTQLTRGACQGAGVDPGDVSSPTFAIVQTYRGRLPVHHADLYRLGDVDELYATGFMDLLGGEGALLVEWADRIAGWLPPDHLVLRLAEVSGRPSWRRIVLEPAGDRHAALARALVAQRKAGPASKPRPKPRPRTTPRSPSKPRSRSPSSPRPRPRSRSGA
jgi:tRNA threonylcarbamoyladenosine biosynthesis protein TsaE